ncbi:MAG: hypothetical protein U0X40_03865 [Ferruginibacter sp.]
MQVTRKQTKKWLLFSYYTCLLLALPGLPAAAGDPGRSAATSTREEAVSFISKIEKLEASAHWPAVKPDLFLQNLKTDAAEPLSIYQGRGTNFCGYGALTYLFLQDDPLGYVKLLLQLYKDGVADFGQIHFSPSESIKKEAGQLKYRGLLDIRPAEQIWFLVLADHFKGYLNFFNKHYDPGDEETFWASVNYAKFNRMVKGLLRYRVHAKGSDLIHPAVDDLYSYISDHLKEGQVVLYINNRIVHKKNHVKIKVSIPTHFIAVQEISRVNDQITLVYWDYGGKTLMQLTPDFLRKITFGVSCCTHY